jgi:hypothetical protein
MEASSQSVVWTPEQAARRQFNQCAGAGLAGLILATYSQAYALSLKDLTDKDATAGLKTALEQGALAAVGILGKPDGFLGNNLVRIPLPGFLNDVGKLMTKLGQSKRVDELVQAMNRGAESAVPFSKDLLRNAVKSMNVVDAKNILSGGDTSVTQFFQGKTKDPLTEKFMPIVNTATEKVGLAQKYNRLAEKGQQMGLVKEQDANIQRYVTTKTLDGLYLVIGEQEKKLRADPLGSSSDILKKVFGLLKK